jgi:hypothetical protein
LPSGVPASSRHGVCSLSRRAPAVVAGCFHRMEEKVDAERAEDPVAGPEAIGTKRPPFFGRRWRTIRPPSVTLECEIEGGRRGGKSS